MRLTDMAPRGTTGFARINGIVCRVIKAEDGRWHVDDASATGAGETINLSVPVWETMAEALDGRAARPSGRRKRK